MTALRPASIAAALAAALVLAATLWAGSRPIGPAPALGSFLDPAHGVWAVSRSATLATRGSSVIPGLSGDVRVVYDRRAVPHIFASTEVDAYRALGYVVARDRLFQMYLQTLAASGRLTEIAGAQALDLDREMRRLGLPRSAERTLVALGDTSTSLPLSKAYADGVNAYIAAMTPSELPLEFRFLGVKPGPWQPINAVHLFNRMGWTLAYSAPELTRALAASRVGSAAAAALVPDDSPIHEPIQPDPLHAPRFDYAPLPPPGAPDSTQASVVAMLGDVMPASAATLAESHDVRRTFASNNWAVSPRRTVAGHALLAGDPHLDLTLPSIWYEVHLVVPGSLDVYGVTIPGAPGIVIGFNRDIAWTFTNTGADVLDLYTEKVDDDAHPTRYLVDGTWHPIEQRIERYLGKHGEVVSTDTLYFTLRGPLRKEHGRWMSMRWTVLEPSDVAKGFQRAARARNVSEFEAAMAASYWAPAQNMLVADRQGSIAIRSTGHFPLRPGDGSGMVVRDGTRSANDWIGMLPVERYPHGLNPTQGYLASANQQPFDSRTAGVWFGGDYDPWRALHINALLRADSQMTADKMRRFQTDPGSARADYFVPYFLRAAQTLASRRDSTVDASKLRESSRLLGEWDRRYTKDSRRAILFELAMRELTDRTWDELQAGPTADRPMRRVMTPASAVLATLLADSASLWWDSWRTPNHVETRDEILAASLVAAMDTARARYGNPSDDRWLWSRTRTANVWHLLRLRALSSLDMPVQGGPATLNPSAGTGGFGSSWRMVVELGPELQAWATYPGGQSGNPASARYRDHMPFWLDGQLERLTVPRTASQLDGANIATLTLHPR